MPVDKRLWILIGTSKAFVSVKSTPLKSGGRLCIARLTYWLSQQKPTYNPSLSSALN
jgi:hypothetical protein